MPQYLVKILTIQLEFQKNLCKRLQRMVIGIYITEQRRQRLQLKTENQNPVERLTRMNFGMILHTLHGRVQIQVYNLILQSMNGTHVLRVVVSMVATLAVNTCSSTILPAILLASIYFTIMTWINNHSILRASATQLGYGQQHSKSVY